MINKNDLRKAISSIAISNAKRNTIYKAFSDLDSISKEEFDSVKSYISKVVESMLTKDTVGKANGVASLDSNGSVPIEQLGNIDTTLFLIVRELPTTDIKTNKIYLVPNKDSQGNNIYVEYLYVENVWENLGEVKAEVDLSEYVNKNELAAKESVIQKQIATKANAQDVTNAIGELQDKIGDRVVVSGNVTNNPDEEDITTEGDTPQTQVLKLKDRAYDSLNASGKGYKILRKNWQTINEERKNVLTQAMINEPNTIYEIRYDFDLNGESINIGEGSVLDFKGGSISNGTINSAIEIISIGKYQIFNNIKFTVRQPCIGYAEWFGAKGDGIHNDYYAINNTINSFVKTVLLCKTYFVESQEEKLFSFSSNTELEGISSMGRVSKLLVSNNLDNIKSKVIDISGSFVKITNILIAKDIQPTSKQEVDYRNTAINVEGHNILLEEITITGFHTAITLNSYLTRLVGINCHHCYNGFYASHTELIMTSLFMVQCYAWQIANIGYYIYGYNYSQLINCAGDQCTLTYSINSCSNIQLNSCASEQSYRYLYIANSTGIQANNLHLLISGKDYLGTQEDYNHSITLSNNIACVFTNLFIKVGSGSAYYKDFLIAIEGYKNYQYAQYTFIGAYLDAGIKFSECAKIYSGYTDYNAISLINSSITSCDMKDLPLLPSSIRYLSIYVRDMGRNAYFDGTKWKDENGFTFMRNKGDTSKRPTIEDPKDAGFEYYDTSLKKKILWNGTSWVNIDGSSLGEQPT